MTAVLDASALLALLFDEPGAEAVADIVADGAAMSAVNLAEVATVLVRNDRDPAIILKPVCEQVSVQPFTDSDALAVGVLYPQVSSRGLSLGDRACLALAQHLDAPAVTAESLWRNLPVDVSIQLIRPEQG